MSESNPNRAEVEARFNLVMDRYDVDLPVAVAAAT